MSAKVKLDDGTEYIITDAEAQMLTEAMVAEKQFVQLNGSMVKIGAIKHFDYYTRPEPERLSESKFGHVNIIYQRRWMGLLRFNGKRIKHGKKAIKTLEEFDKLLVSDLDKLRYWG